MASWNETDMNSCNIQAKGLGLVRLSLEKFQKFIFNNGTLIRLKYQTCGFEYDSMGRMWGKIKEFTRLAKRGYAPLKSFFSSLPRETKKEIY